MSDHESVDDFKVGWVKEAHGLKGEVYVKLLSKDPEWLDELSQIALLKDGERKVYLVKKWRRHKQGLIVVLEGVTNRNQSEELKGAEFCIPSGLLVTADGEVPYLIEFMGFQVIDAKLGAIGEIVGFADNGAQDLIEVKGASGQVHLVPFVDAFIEKILKLEKTIHMNLPEGLIE
jgi:16S rRNA processing protein RimM